MGTLRVIAGSAKGFHLRDVPGEGTRPITDRVKESLFNILGPDVAGSTWWDVFGGTGAVGIEALSRGADFVRFTENNRDAVTAINENLSRTNFSPKSKVIRCNAFQMLKQPSDQVFDYIYIAPPQYNNLWFAALEAINEHPGWLKEDGWIIVQIHPIEYHPLDLSKLIEFDQRKYGSTLLVFLERKTEEFISPIPEK